MSIQRGRLVSGGRLQVPAEMRRLLGLSDGDTVIMEVVNGELHVRPLREALARVRELLRPYRSESGSVVDEFIAERRAEAAKE
jgi:antitoxin PrlF